MKKLIFFLLTFISVSVFGQYTPAKNVYGSQNIYGNQYVKGHLWLNNYGMPLNKGLTGQSLKLDGDSLIFFTEKFVIGGAGLDSTIIDTNRNWFAGVSMGYVIDTIYCKMLQNSGSPDVTFKVYYGTSFTPIGKQGTVVITAGSQVTSYTTQTKIYTFNNSTIPAGNMIWVKFSAVSVLPKSVFITIIGHRQ